MYEPKVNDVVTFADAYDATTEYRVTSVYSDRAILEPVVKSDYTAGFEACFDILREMGITPVTKPEPEPEPERDALAELADLRAKWQAAMVNLLAKIDIGLTIASAFGDDVANLVVPIDALAAEAAELTLVGDVLDTLEAMAGLTLLAQMVSESETAKA